MTKKILLYAFAAITAICLTACGSDDDKDNGKKENNVNLPVPPNANNAKQFQLDNPKAPLNAHVDDPELRTFDITESNDILLEFRHPVSKETVYVKGKVTQNNDQYVIDGERIRGFINLQSDQSRLTRAGEQSIVIDIEVKFNNVTYTYKTVDGNQELVKVITPIPGDEAVDRLARTWTILGLILDLKGETNSFESWEAKNGVFDLETTVLKTAMDRNVSLTEDEKNELRKKLQGITVTKSGLFTLNYTSGSVDAASWQWTDTSKKSFRITLKDGKMGNKFIQNTSLITVEFNGDRCNMKLTTTFTDNSNKTWNAIVTLQLKA